MIAIMQEYGEVVCCVAGLSMWATQISSFEPMWARKNPGCLFWWGEEGSGGGRGGLQSKHHARSNVSLSRQHRCGTSLPAALPQGFTKGLPVRDATAGKRAHLGIAWQQIRWQHGLGRFRYVCVPRGHVALGLFWQFHTYRSYVYSAWRDMRTQPQCRHYLAL